MPGTPRFRIHEDEAVLVLMDYQASVLACARDVGADVFRKTVLGLAGVAKDHDLPTIFTTKAGEGRNDPLMQDLAKAFPDAPFIVRSGQADAWDNGDLVASIKATGRTQIILAGVAAEGCVTSLALSAGSDGFQVTVAADACGTFGADARRSAWERLSAAGAQLMTVLAVSVALQPQGRRDLERRAPARPPARKSPFEAFGADKPRASLASFRPPVPTPIRLAAWLNRRPWGSSRRPLSEIQPLWRTS